MSRLGIVGAGSFIGVAVEAYLQAERPGAFEITHIETRDGAWRGADFSCYDSLFYVAGVVPWALDRKGLGISSEADEQTYLNAVNANLTYQIAKKAKADGVSHVAFLSTSDVYAKRDSADPRCVVDARTEPEPQSTYGKSKLLAEGMLHELESTDFHVAILRLPMVYGPNCTKGSFASLVKLCAKVPAFPNVGNARSTLFTGNLAELVALLALSKADGTYLPQDPTWASTSELVRLICEAQGKRVRLVGGLSGLCSFMACHNETARKVFGNFRYSHAASDEELGYQRFSLEEAIGLSL